MDALKPFPSFKSVIGLEVPSGERCHNDTALLHNSTSGQPLPHPHSVHVGCCGRRASLGLPDVIVGGGAPVAEGGGSSLRSRGNPLV